MTTLPPDVLAETGRSTATTYHFRSSPGATAWFGGWATCTVNDATGELSIQSDWTEPCAYRWNVGNLTEFLAGDRGGYCGYLVNKLLPPDRRKRFCPEATVKAMRRRVVEARRDGDLDRATARELWDGLGDLAGYDDVHAFFAHLCEDTAYGDRFDDFGEDERKAPTSEATALERIILPALVEACRREVERRRLTAAHGPQPAAAGAVA